LRAIASAGNASRRRTRRSPRTWAWTPKRVRRYAQSLQKKGFLRRQPRKARTNLFDLTQLFRALEMEIFGKVVTPGLL
jgi:hypothetical protein